MARFPTTPRGLEMNYSTEPMTERTLSFISSAILLIVVPLITALFLAQQF